jgi:hypothetical protein
VQEPGVALDNAATVYNRSERRTAIAVYPEAV